MTKTLHTNAFRPSSLPQSVLGTKLVTGVDIINCSVEMGETKITIIGGTNSIINNFKV